MQIRNSLCKTSYRENLPSPELHSHFMRGSTYLHFLHFSFLLLFSPPLLPSFTFFTLLLSPPPSSPLLFTSLPLSSPLLPSSLLLLSSPLLPSHFMGSPPSLLHSSPLLSSPLRSMHLYLHCYKRVSISYRATYSIPLFPWPFPECWTLTEDMTDLDLWYLRE